MTVDAGILCIAIDLWEVESQTEGNSCIEMCVTSVDFYGRITSFSVMSQNERLSAYVWNEHKLIMYNV